MVALVKESQEVEQALDPLTLIQAEVVPGVAKEFGCMDFRQRREAVEFFKTAAQFSQPAIHFMPIRMMHA
jgi:hypothetical protein